MTETEPFDLRLRRLAGLCALTGAGLRVATALPLRLGATTGEQLYAAIDLLLLLGLIGGFAERPLRRGPGAAGFVVAVAGFLLIRTGPRLGPLGDYAFAVGVLGLGLALIGAAAWRTGGLVRGAGVAWIGSLLVGVAGGALGTPVAFLVASLLFCLGFAGLGARLLYREAFPLAAESRAPTTEPSA